VRRVASIAVLVPLLLGLPSPAWAGKSVKSWNERLQVTVAQLREGGWAEAKVNAQAGLEDLGRFLAPGGKAGSAVAMFLMCRAVAEAGLGEEREAIWDWQVAQQLDPRLESWKLTEFGPAGALLDRFRLPIRIPAATIRIDPERLEAATPPEKIAARAPIYYEGARALGIQSKVVFDVVIGLDGRTTHPRLIEKGPIETLTQSAADAIRAWRFHPARQGDENVPCDYRLTVAFTLSP
jgi:TonB family protein